MSACPLVRARSDPFSFIPPYQHLPHQWQSPSSPQEQQVSAYIRRRERAELRSARTCRMRLRAQSGPPKRDAHRRVETVSAPILPTLPRSGLMECRTAVERVLRVGGLAGYGECGRFVRDGRRTCGGKTMGILIQVCFLSSGARIFPHQQRPDRVAGRSCVERAARPRPPTTTQCPSPSTQTCPTSTRGRTALSKHC